MTFIGIWIEKGMGLIIPGFIPSTLGEIVEYVPSLTEWKVVIGVWAFGLLVYMLLIKVAFNALAHEKRLPVNRIITSHRNLVGRTLASTRSRSRRSLVLPRFI